MYDKTVRRRRAALALLVACAVGLLTLSFGGSAGSGVGAVQRGFLEALSPVQDGASRALKPVRDLFGWFGDTADAKKQRDGLRSDLRRTRRELVVAQAAARQNAAARKLVGLDDQATLNEMGPRTARVTVRSPTVWYSTIQIDKGTGDGVRVGQPVVTGDGLIGTVTTAVGRAAVVTLISDHTSGVSAQIAASGLTGVVQSDVGNPGELLLRFIRRGDRVRVGQQVVTSGSRSSRVESLFPAQIPIGTVSRVDDTELDLYQTVHVKPFARLRRVDFVQVLTRPKTAPVLP